MTTTARARDLWDVLANLQNLTTPDLEIPGEVLDALQGPFPESIPLADAASTPNQGHSGVYYYDNATSMYGKAQYG